MVKVRAFFVMLDENGNLGLCWNFFFFLFYENRVPIFFIVLGQGSSRDTCNNIFTLYISITRNTFIIIVGDLAPIYIFNIRCLSKGYTSS